MVGLAFAIAGIMAAAGLYVVRSGIGGMEFDTTLNPTASASKFDPRTSLLATTMAVIAAIAYFAITGWISAAIAAFLACLGAPTLRSSNKGAQRRADKLDAIASWVESLRDSVLAAGGLEQALRFSMKLPPEALKTELAALQKRMTHSSSDDCLREFANDVGDPVCDRIVAGLLLSMSGGGGSISSLLTQIASDARSHSSLIRETEAGRISVYMQGRWTITLGLGYMMGAILYRHDRMPAFQSFTGQLVLAGCLIAIGISWLVFYRLQTPTEMRRPLKKTFAVQKQSAASETEVASL